MAATKVDDLPEGPEKRTRFKLMFYRNHRAHGVGDSIGDRQVCQVSAPKLAEDKLKDIAEKVRDALEGGAPLADANYLMRLLREAILATQTPPPDSSRPDAS